MRSKLCISLVWIIDPRRRVPQSTVVRALAMHLSQALDNILAPSNSPEQAYHACTERVTVTRNSRLWHIQTPGKRAQKTDNAYASLLSGDLDSRVKNSPAVYTFSLIILGRNAIDPAQNSHFQVQAACSQIGGGPGVPGLWSLSGSRLCS